MIANGQSEIDTISLRLPDYGIEIKNWSQYQFTQTFLVPTAAWSFRLSAEDATLTNELLVEGARVELVCNGLVQCSGTIDRKTTDGDTGSGTVVTVQGRDILGRVVDATVDPIFRFAAGMTIVDVVAAVLKPFGITTIHNSDEANVNAVTGYGKGQGPKAQKVTTQTIDIATDARGNNSIKYVAGKTSLAVSPNRPDLTKMTIEQAKPHMGEGVWAYLDRLLKRLRLTMWALADGSGVVIDRADFASPPQQTITRRRSDPSKNNVVRGMAVTDLSTQPSCIVAFGFGGGKDVQKTALKVIMINELVGLDESGQPLPEILAIKARYKNAKALPIRPEVTPLRRPRGDRKLATAVFLKDDESKNLAQLEAFVRREMGERQQKALQVSYDLVGHTFERHPWCVNTQVSVVDEVLNVRETLWVLEKTFSKVPGHGTTASLKLIRPNTLQI